MDTNKNEFEELENTAEAVEEEVQPVVEEEAPAEEVVAADEVFEETAEAYEEDALEETAEEFADDLAENIDAADEMAEEVLEYVDEVNEITEDFSEAEKKKPVGLIVTLIIVLLLIVAGVVAFATGLIGGNKYNKMGYINYSGQTIEQIAEQSGLTLEQFLQEYSLPADMPADTTVSAAVYNMPLSVYIKTNIGVEYEEVKDMLGLPTETTPDVPKNLLEKLISKFKKEEPQPIDGNTPWYIVEGEMTIQTYAGGDVDGFKEFYKLGEEVTGETKIKEIRDQMNKVEAEMLAEQQAQSAGAVDDANAEGEAQQPEAEVEDTQADASAEGEQEAAQTAQEAAE